MLFYKFLQNHLTHHQVEKLGNTLLYLPRHVGDLSKTMILKLAVPNL